MPRLVVPLLAFLALAGCAAVLPPTASPTESPGPTDAGASPMPAESPTEPDSSPSPFLPAIGVPGTARSLVDLLSVRTRPDTDATLVDAIAFDGELVTDSYRLSTGEFVRVVSGPLFNDGFAWYRVEPIVGLVTWESGIGGVRAGQGWVAGGGDGEPFLEPADPPFADPPPTPRPADLLEVAFNGVAQQVSPAFVVDAPLQIEWDAADPTGTGCQLQINLVPDAGGAAYQIVRGTIGGLPQGDTWTAQVPGGEYVLRVDGRCSWAVLVSEVTS